MKNSCFLERPPSTQQLIFCFNLKAQNYAMLDAKYSKYLTNLHEQVIRKVDNIIQTINRSPVMTIINSYGPQRGIGSQE